MEPQLVDVGPVLFDRASDREVSIHNKGRVQFLYEVDTGALSRPSVCDVSPKTGSVLPGQHAVLKLKVCFLGPCHTTSAVDRICICYPTLMQALPIFLEKYTPLLQALPIVLDKP